MRILLGMALLVNALAQTTFSSSPRPKLPPNHPFSITISTPRDKVDNSAQIGLSILLKNTSNHDLVLGECIHAVWDHYRILVQDGDHKPAPKTVWYQRMTGGCPPAREDTEHSGGTTICVDTNSSIICQGQSPYQILKPDEIVEEDIVINDYYDLSQPGVYAIQVERGNYPEVSTVLSVPGKLGYSRNLRMDETAANKKYESSRAGAASNTITVTTGMEPATKAYPVQPSSR